MLCNTKAPGQLQASCAWRKQMLHLPSRLTVQSHLNKPGLCRWAPDSKEAADAADAGEGNTKDSSKDPMTSRRLINQLLQIQSMSSMQSVDISPADDKELSKVVQQASQMHLQQTELPSASSSSSAAQQLAPAAADESNSLFDDPAAEDFDPLVLDML